MLPDDDEEEKAVDLSVSSSKVTSRKVPPDRKKGRGRPKGSRTTGLSKIKRFKSVKVDEESLVGVACGIGTCGVRFKKGENLVMHRRCHTDGPNDDTFACFECGSPRPSFVGWRAMALHLWNKHQIDMELYSCDQCQHFRSFTLSRLQDHKGALLFHPFFASKYCAVI